MKLNTSESITKSSIVKYFKTLQDKGIPLFYECRQAGGFAYKKGIPDIYCVLNGIHIEIEVKTEIGKQSTMQEKFEERCIKLWNIKYLCAHSLDDVKQYINNLIRINC